MSDNLQKFIGPELSDLLTDGDRLVASASGGFHDYSFIIFPYAKVYEGFLKKLFLQLGAISKEQYTSKRWRVGKALNPQLENDLRGKESVYDRIINLCGSNKDEGKELADILWEAWKNGRNRVFHFFPGEHKAVTFEEAKVVVNQIINAMEKSLESCRM